MKNLAAKTILGFAQLIVALVLFLFARPGRSIFGKPGSIYWCSLHHPH